MPLIDNASVSSVPSISASPETSRLPASSSPVRVIFLNDPISLFASTTTAFEAATVPAVMPSSISSSASLITAPEPSVKSPPTVRLPATAVVLFATVALGVIVRCVTYVPALLISLPSVSVPPSAMFSFHSSPASSPSSAMSVIARPAPSAADIFSESVVVSSY